MTTVRRKNRPMGGNVEVKGAIQRGAALCIILTSLVAGVAVYGSSAAGAVAKPTKSEIVIGMENAVTGTSGEEDGGDKDVGIAWEDWVNQELGGINGHPVKIIFEDTKGVAATASVEANQLVQDKVIAEVGGVDLATDSIWSQVLTQAKIPVIEGNWPDTAATIESSPYIFALAADTGESLPLVVDAAKTVGASSFGSVICVEEAVCKSIVPIFQQRANQISMSDVGYVQVAAAAPSYDAACLTLEGDKAKFVDLSVEAVVATRVVSDCSAQGYHPIFGSENGAFDGPSLVPLSKAGASFAGVINAFPWYLNTKPIDQYRSVMKKYSPTHAVPENEAPSGTWASLEMFRQAMANAGSHPTAANVYTAMTSVKADNLNGLLAQKVSFAPGKPSSPPNCAWIVTLKHGTFGGGTIKCT
jgi:branched-chain amino acid transport system substrate-binding protein